MKTQEHNNTKNVKTKKHTKNADKTIYQTGNYLRHRQ